MTNPFSFDVFVSHNTKDKPRVRRLAARLRAAGVRVWLDEWIIKPGDDIYLAVERGLQAARVQVLCMSPDALGSDWVGLERSTVVFRDPRNVGRRFIPLLLADCDLPDTLRRYKYVDYRKESDAAFEQLLTACRGVDEQTAPLEEAKGREPGGAGNSATNESQREAVNNGARPGEKGLPAKGIGSATEGTHPELLALLERTIEAHQGRVDSLAVSPDGAWATSGGEDTTVKIWELETGDCRMTLGSHIRSVRCVAITPDGKSILAGSSDHKIAVWAASDGRQISSWKASEHAVLSIVAMPDGRRAISAGNNHNVRMTGAAFKLWDFTTQKCLARFESGGPAQTVALTGDGKRVVSGFSDGALQVWNLETGKFMKMLSGHSAAVTSIQVTRDGRHAVSSSLDTTVKIWDLETLTCIGTLEGHEGPAVSVAISSDGVIASAGSTVRLWDLNSGACLQVVEGGGALSVPLSVAFNPDRSRLVVGSAFGVISVYRLTGVGSTPPAESTRRYVNAKVVLLGESTVGKTTLALRLIEDRYVVTEATHGMNVARLHLPLEPDDTIEREALLWDLAGQED
jgi:hypothetical protein